MYHTHVLTVCHCLKCTQITWKTSQQSRGHNLKDVGQEISQNNTVFGNFLTNMYHTYEYLYVILI